MFFLSLEIVYRNLNKFVSIKDANVSLLIWQINKLQGPGARRASNLGLIYELINVNDPGRPYNEYTNNYDNLYCCKFVQILYI